MYSQWDSNGDIEMPVPPMTPEELQRIIEYFSIQKPGPALIGPARTSLRPDLYPGGKFINGLYQPNAPQAQAGSGILVDPVTGLDINPPSPRGNLPAAPRGISQVTPQVTPQSTPYVTRDQLVTPQNPIQATKPYFSDLANIPSTEEKMDSWRPEDRSIQRDQRGLRQSQQDIIPASSDIEEILAAQGAPRGPIQGGIAPETPLPSSSGQTPEKTNADDREKRLRRLEAFRGIAEGLGSIATGFERASLIRAGLNPSLAQPYVAETIRGRIDREEDRISPQDRESFAKMGMELPEGMTYSKLRMVSPLLASIGRSKTAADITSRRQDIRDRERLETAFQTERGKMFGDTRLRKLKEIRDGAGTALKKLSLNDNPQSIRSAMVAIARGSGEVGVLTQKDIDAYEGKIGIPGFFNVTIQKVITGDYSDWQKEKLKELATLLRDQSSELLENEKKARLKSFEETNKDILNRHGKTTEDIERSFGDIFGIIGKSEQTNTQNETQVKVGQKIKGKDGKLYTVKKVNSDGSVDVE